MVNWQRIKQSKEASVRHTSVDQTDALRPLKEVVCVRPPACPAGRNAAPPSQAKPETERSERRELHPRPRSRKLFRRKILASNRDASGCTMSALTRHSASLSPPGVAWHRKSGTRSWNWRGPVSDSGGVSPPKYGLRRWIVAMNGVQSSSAELAICGERVAPLVAGSCLN